MKTHISWEKATETNKQNKKQTTPGVGAGCCPGSRSYSWGRGKTTEKTSLLRLKHIAPKNENASERQRMALSPLPPLSPIQQTFNLLLGKGKRMEKNPLVNQPPI